MILFFSLDFSQMQYKKILAKLLQKDFPEALIDRTIPIFAPKSSQELAADKYENALENVDYYTGIVAYGAQLLGLGGAESLYETINALVLKHLYRDRTYTFLDVACGTGRTIYDLAALFPDSNFVGLDYSYLMAQRAKAILMDSHTIDIDVKRYGFGKPQLQGKGYENVAIVQGDAMALPFKTASFDCVCNTYLIDRVADPILAIQESIRVLKKGGLLVLTDPLSFDQASNYQKPLSPQQIIEIVQQAGINVQGAHDGLLFRQKADLRENYYQYSTFVLYGLKE